MGRHLQQAQQLSFQEISEIQRTCLENSITKAQFFAAHSLAMPLQSFYRALRHEPVKADVAAHIRAALDVARAHVSSSAEPTLAPRAPADIIL